MKLVCQIILMLLLAKGLGDTLLTDVEGQAAKPALGFRGVMATLIAYGVRLTLLYFCGALSEIGGR